MATPATTVPMISPDGKIGDIPVERVDDATKAGFKRGVDMISPDGKHGTIPVDRAEEAQKAGFKQLAASPNMQPSFSAMAVGNSPSGADPQNPGNPNLNAVPQSERASVNSDALKTQASSLIGEGGAMAGMKAVDSALSYLGFGAKAAKGTGAVASATGILDQYGSPIFKMVAPEARPVLQQILSHDAVQKALKTAGQEVLKGTLYGAAGAGGGTAAYKVLHHLFD